MATGTGILVLPQVRLRGKLRGTASVSVVAGAVRVGQSTVLQFRGPPYAVLEWSVLTEGGGSIYTDKSYTDGRGVATAIFTANAVTGEVMIRVRYGA